MAQGGVISDYNPDNAQEIILTFDKAADANALLKALDRVVEDDAPAVDPDPAPDAPAE